MKDLEKVVAARVDDHLILSKSAHLMFITVRRKQMVSSRSANTGCSRGLCSSQHHDSVNVYAYEADAPSHQHRQAHNKAQQSAYADVPSHSTLNSSAAARVRVTDPPPPSCAVAPPTELSPVRVLPAYDSCAHLWKEEEGH